jgi:dTDP-4-dehydrorhamnose reductase
MSRLFKQPRMLIMGCGDIGLRIIQSAPNFWRFICTNTRPKTIDKVEISRANLNNAQRIKNFVCNLDNVDENNTENKKNKHTLKHLKRLECLIRMNCYIIYLIPPQNYAYVDKRIQHMQHTLSKPMYKKMLEFTTAIKFKPKSKFKPKLIIKPKINKYFKKINKRFVYVSTTGVYGNHDGSWINECTLVNPQSLRAHRRVNAEQYMRKLCKKTAIHNNITRLNLSIARVPGIYAQNRLPLARLQQQVPILNKEEDVYTNHIHADDLARILKRMLFKKRANCGRVFNIVDDSDIKAGDWLEYIAQKYALPMPKRMNKDALMQIIDERRRSFLNESRRIHNQRLKKELNIKLKYPSVFDGA